VTGPGEARDGIAPATGELSHTGVIAEMPNPACMTIVRRGASH
jgi:hypothetical protein